MSKIVSPIAKIGSAALGVASFIPGPWQPFAAAGSVGLGLLGGAIGSKNGKGANQQQQALQLIAQMLQQPPPLTKSARGTASPRILAYGRVANAGAVFLEENDPTKAYYILGLYLNEGPIDGLDALICDDEFVPLTNNFAGTLCDFFWPTSGTKSATPFISGSITIELANGAPSGKWSTILNRDATIALIGRGLGTGWAPFWNNTHLGKGCTILYTVSAFNVANRLAVFPNGLPTFLAIYRAARVYDPRDPGQIFSQDSFSIYEPHWSWKWSENPALCAAHYVSYLVSQNLTAIRGVNWESIKEAANDCDRLAPKRMNGFNGGTLSYEPFARVSALIKLDEEPRDVLAKFMDSCDGDWGVDQNGLFTMWVRKWEDPIVIFDGGDISDYGEDFGPTMNAELNYIHTFYADFRVQNQRPETPIYRDAQSENQIGRRTGAFAYDWVNSPDQAYRLTARKIRRANGRRSIECTLGPRAMTALKQRVVGLNVPDLGLLGTWRVEDLTPTDSTLANWHAVLTEIAPDAYDDQIIPVDPIYGLALVNQPAIATPTYLAPNAISTGSGVGVAQLSLDINKNYPDQSNPTITFAALQTDPTLTLDGRYSTDGGTTWVNFSVLLSAMIMQTAELPRGTTVTMQARFVAASGAVGSYSSSVTATIP